MIEFWRLFGYLKPKDGETIVDLGCGEGSNDIALSVMGGQIYGVDIDGQTLRHAKATASKLGVSVGYVVSDLSRAVAFKDKSFDKAVSFCVLEHLDEPEAFLVEANRILRAEGLMALSVDSFSCKDTPEKLKGRHAELCRVRKYYTKKEMTELLHKCGFRIMESDFSIKSPLSCHLFQMLMQAYFRSLSGRPFTLWLLKLTAPVLFFLAAVSDALERDEEGGYWLTLLAVKERSA